MKNFEKIFILIFIFVALFGLFGIITAAITRTEVYNIKKVKLEKISFSEIPYIYKNSFFIKYNGKVHDIFYHNIHKSKDKDYISLNFIDCEKSNYFDLITLSKKRIYSKERCYKLNKEPYAEVFISSKDKLVSF